MTDRLRLFVACAPGLEPLLARELVDLGVEEVAATAGGVGCFGDLDAIHRINLGSGLGLRALIRVAEFIVRDFAKLERVAKTLEWERWLLPLPGVAQGRAGVRVRAHAKRSRLYHTKAIVERVERGIAQRLGARVELRADEAEGPGGGELGVTGAREPVLVQVRIIRDRCTISVDTTGTLLHKRGWRLETAKAPLREDIARALVLLSGWRPGMALLDPVAGAGTLVIEAATLARGLPPGLGRTFSSVDQGHFDPARFEQQRRELADALRRGEPGPALIGCDRDAGAVAAAQRNAARAGVEANVQFLERSVGDRELPPLELGTEAGVALVANPPWGQRVGDPGRLRNLYASLGQLARRLPRPTPIAIATADPALAAATELGLERRLLTDQGGVKVGLWTGTLE